MEQILVMSQSAATVLIAVPLIEATRRYLTSIHAILKSVVIGALFMLVGMLLMFNPVLAIDGIRAGGWGSVVALAAAFYGPACIIVCVGLAVTRFILCGMGALPGILSMAIIAAASLALWHWASKAKTRLTQWHMLLYAVIATASPAIVGITVPSMSWELWLDAVSVFGPTNFVAVLIPGMILVRDRERNRALADRNDARAQLDTIAENAPTILFEIDLDAEGRPRFAYVTHAAEYMLDVTPDTLRGDFSAFEALLPVSSRTTLRSLIRESAVAGKTWTFETEAVRSDRQSRWLQITAKSRLNADGNPVWDGTIADMTDQRKLDRMKDDFIAVVSHELKTPVTALRGSLGLLSSAAAGEPNPRIAQLVALGERNAERLVLLVNDIIEMQNLRTQKLRLVIAAHAVRPLLELAVETARVQASERNIEVILDEDIPDAEIDVDSERLQQVLANLMSNAIKFSPAGSTVILSCAALDGWLRLSVWDNGPGIPEEFHPRIFDAFTQAEPPKTRRAGGTGLGLRITKALVDEMGGRIHFDVEAGQGTTFHVDLPHIDSETATDLSEAD